MGELVLPYGQSVNLSRNIVPIATPEAMEELRARHRREQKDLQGRITQKKKQASKKSRKGVNDECDRLEVELLHKQAAEIDALPSEDLDSGAHPVAERLEDLSLSQAAAGERHEKRNGEAVPATQAPNTTADEKPESIVPSQVRKGNRQKARLARRAAEQEEVARQAAEEARDLPDARQQERDRMLEHMSERKLTEKEIRADGHCLYSAVADQLRQIGIPLGAAPGDEPELPYKATRKAAASYIEQHAADFAGFLEEPLPDYVHKVRDTAEWGGQLELQALAKSYDVEINVLQDFGRVEKIEPGSDGQGKSIWLGYYKHGFGLGEHYNSLRKAP